MIYTNRNGFDPVMQIILRNRFFFGEINPYKILANFDS